MKNMELKDIPKLIKKLDKKIESLETKEGIEKVVLDSTLPSGSLLESVNDTEKLVSEFTKIMMSHDAYNKSVEMLGVDVSEYKFNGHTLEEWKNAVKYKVHELSVGDEIKKLKETKSVLEKNMEEEDRKKREIAKAMEDINLD